MTEWFEQWFGEEYLQLYPHRDEKDAAQAVSLVDRVARLNGSRVLDLACGPGRHAVPLTERGAAVWGIDLSMALLARAKQFVPPVRGVVRGDMRLLPFRDASFDLVANLFTSFGYFADDDQHAAVLHGVARVLVPGGKLFLDYLNAQAVRDALVPQEERQFGEHRVAIERKLVDGERFIVKEMHLVDDGRKFLERVRLFSPEDLMGLIEGSGLRVTDIFGSYAGEEWTAATPRTIMVAQLPGDLP